jgi:hypothetical protein
VKKPVLSEHARNLRIDGLSDSILILRVWSAVIIVESVICLLIASYNITSLVCLVFVLGFWGWERMLCRVKADLEQQQLEFIRDATLFRIETQDERWIAEYLEHCKEVGWEPEITKENQYDMGIRSDSH